MISETLFKQFIIDEVKKSFEKKFKDDDIKEILINYSIEYKLWMIECLMTKNNYGMGAVGPASPVGGTYNLFDTYGNEITDNYVKTNKYPENLDPIKKEILEFYNNNITSV